MGISVERFGLNAHGGSVEKYTLTNKSGASVSLLTYGGVIQAICVPDKNGRLSDVCLGFDNMETYLAPNGSMGAFIGRYGNRIDYARFTLDGHEYRLRANMGESHLHGGPLGFQTYTMQAEAREDNGIDHVKMSMYSPDGDECYPGSLDVSVIYSFDDNMNLSIRYEAHTDSATILNLTNHCYFNLAGQDFGPIDNHLITIPADCVTRINERVVPTGDFFPVAGTPLDLRHPKRMGDGLKEGEGCQQMVLGSGYDHNYVLNKAFGMGLCAVVEEPVTGRVMEVITDQPGLQFYSGNHMNLKGKGKGGADYLWRNAFCLETQRFPDSPNHLHFPSTVLRKGELFTSVTIYAFRTRG